MYGAVPYVIWTTGALPPAETGGHLIYSTGTQYNMYDGLTGHVHLQHRKRHRPKRIARGC